MVMVLRKSTRSIRLDDQRHQLLKFVYEATKEDLLCIRRADSIRVAKNANNLGNTLALILVRRRS
jgi:hypothetical protein